MATNSEDIKVEVSQDETYSMDVEATAQNPAGDNGQVLEGSNFHIKQEGESNDQVAGASATTSVEAGAADSTSTDKGKPPATIEITDNGFARTVPVHTNPGPKDVIFGRGEPTRTHSGNLMLREYVSQRLQEYMQTTKTKKSAIIGLVIKEVEEAGARYLVPLDASSRHSIFTGGCREATRAEVRSKVSHAFRDGEKRALLKRQKAESQEESQEKSSSSKQGAKADGKGNSAGSTSKPKESSSDLLSFATILTSLRDKSPSTVPENENGDSENVKDEQDVGNGAQSMKSPGSITKNLELHCGVLDIVFGRGAPLRRHPGNIRFREIVESFTARYKAASKHKKTEIIKQVIEQVSENGARFLIMEDGSVKSATPDEIRMKVSHRFRDFSKASSTSSGNSRTSPSTTTPPVLEKVSEENPLDLVHSIPEPEMPMESDTPDNIVQV